MWCIIDPLNIGVAMHKLRHNIGAMPLQEI
jgi:hypothetical protein